MRRVLPFAFVVLPALTAAALVGPSAATPTGKLTFTGRVIDGDAPLAPGRVVTIHGAVIARSATCIEARVDLPAHHRDAMVWLCSHGAKLADDSPDVGADFRHQDHRRRRDSVFRFLHPDAYGLSDCFDPVAMCENAADTSRNSRP